MKWWDRMPWSYAKWNKPVTKPRITRDIKQPNRNKKQELAGRRKGELYCNLMRTEFQFPRKSSGNWIHNNVNTLNTTEHWKMVLMANVTCIKPQFMFFSWWGRTVCGILVPWPGIEPGPSAQSSNHWTAREFPNHSFKKYQYSKITYVSCRLVQSLLVWAICFHLPGLET